jgi:hypothetical protein
MIFDRRTRYSSTALHSHLVFVQWYAMQGYGMRRNGNTACEKDDTREAVTKQTSVSRINTKRQREHIHKTVDKHRRDLQTWESNSMHGYGEIQTYSDEEQ